MKIRSMTPTRMVAALVAAGVIGGAGATYFSGSHARAAYAVTPPVAAIAANSVVGAPDFSQIAERYGAAVVNISVSGVKHAANDSDEAPAARQRGMPGFDPNDPFYEFFRRFQAPEGGVPGHRDMPVRGQGSGFIVSSDGLILTNAHVVRDAKEVIVKLTDRREFQATVLGSDPKTDVAVIRIGAKNLPTVPLGSARDLKVGEWVLAIGSPFGFENSVTAGVVSAKGRSLPDENFVPFIQTDVAVNPGNSGGPLFNVRGEVVGINSQIFSRTGGYQGLSFAIPIEVAAKVRDQIVATGSASHARLGVSAQDVNQALADSFGLDKPEGALISSVLPGSAAEKAGLKTGDVVRKVDGAAIVAAGDLSAAIGQSTPGQKVALEVWRHGKVQQVSATLGNASDKPVQKAEKEDAAGKARLGLALRPLQPGEKQSAGVQGGLLIEDASGPAAMAGVQPGDVLTAINGVNVSSVEQVRAMLDKAGKSVALLIHRDGDTIFVPVRIG